MERNIEKIANTKNELSREEKLQLEQQAIHALLDLGAKFSVQLKEKPQQVNSFVAFYNKSIKKKPLTIKKHKFPKDWDVTIEEKPHANISKMEKVYMRNFYIQPLYLGTIDYLRKLYISIEFEEGKFNESPLSESKKYFKYIGLMAEIAAVAVINNSSLKKETKQIRELKQFFIEHLTVPTLQRLVNIINQMMNPGGFTNSIRLISEIGVTQPKANLIEKKSD